MHSGKLLKKNRGNLTSDYKMNLKPYSHWFSHALRKIGQYIFFFNQSLGFSVLSNSLSQGVKCVVVSGANDLVSSFQTGKSCFSPKLFTSPSSRLTKKGQKQLQPPVHTKSFSELFFRISVFKQSWVGMEIPF